MESTSQSLLQRLRSPGEEEAWRRFVQLYAPLIFYWGRQKGLDDSDASDLVQEVMTILLRELPRFEYDPNRRFRGWLRQITVNKTRDIQRKQKAQREAGLDGTVAPIESRGEADLFGEDEYRSFLAQRAMKLMKAEFQETTWKACWMHVVEGRRAADIGQELGISANAVHIAKCRVVRRLREELDDLAD